MSSNYKALKNFKNRVNLIYNTNKKLYYSSRTTNICQTCVVLNFCKHIKNSNNNEFKFYEQKGL